MQEELRRRDRGAAVRVEIAADAPTTVPRAALRALKLDAGRRLPGARAGADPGPRGRGRRRPARRTAGRAARARRAAAARATPGRSGRPLAAARRAAPPPVRVVRARRSASSRRRPRIPNVLAIKQTLYRTSGDSPIVRALSRAAENGKQVTVARRDQGPLRRGEQHRLGAAARGGRRPRRLRPGRAEDALQGRARRAARGPTASAATSTSAPATTTRRRPRVYTDLSLFTAAARDRRGRVATCSTCSPATPSRRSWRKLAVAPLRAAGARRRARSSARPTARARASRRAIIAKMNSLVDPVVIRALYAASAGGRGDRPPRARHLLPAPGRPGRLGEHPRASPSWTASSSTAASSRFGAARGRRGLPRPADWMPRNFHRRVEVMFPVEDPALRGRLLDEVLGTSLRDTVKARRLRLDGTYERVEVRGEPLRSQQSLPRLRAPGRRGADATPRAAPGPRPRARPRARAGLPADRGDRRRDAVALTLLPQVSASGFRSD